MNPLMFEVSQFCATMTVKNFREYADLGPRAVQRSVGTKRELDKLENVIKMNEWLELKIKTLIKMKKKAEKVLDEYNKRGSF